MVEQQMSSLTREYELEKQLYNTLSRASSRPCYPRISNAESQQQFAVLYPAGLPTLPSSPDFLRVMLLASVMGLAVGIALTFAREYPGPRACTTREHCNTTSNFQYSRRFRGLQSADHGASR